VSVETVQQSAASNSAALLTIMTHMASERDLEAVVVSLKEDDSVVSVASVIRVEGL
jgi:homoserine dehydrogenase